MGVVTIGCDIGQRRDPSAIVVVERDRVTEHGPWLVPRGRVVVDGRDITRETRHEIIHTVRHLERLPLGTPYPAVADRVATIAVRATRYTNRRPTLVIDATGVGAPAVDLIRERLRHSGIRVVALTFVHGDRLTLNGDIGSIGKTHLVSGLQVLLESGRLKLPMTAEARDLAAELLDFEVRITAAGNDQYGAFKVGAHDDMAVALGLATLEMASRELLVVDG